MGAMVHSWMSSEQSPLLDQRAERLWDGRACLLTHTLLLFFLFVLLLWSAICVSPPWKKVGAGALVVPGTGGQWRTHFALSSLGAVVSRCGRTSVGVFRLLLLVLFRVFVQT